MSSCKMYVGQEALEQWPQVEGLLHKAALWSNGEWDTAHVLVKLLDSTQQLWIFRNDEGEITLVLVTEILTFPRKTICNIYAAAGHDMLKLWERFSAYGISWLEALGVTEVQTYCRDEVMEKIKLIGFQKVANLMRFTWKEQS